MKFECGRRERKQRLMLRLRQRQRKRRKRRKKLKNNICCKRSHMCSVYVRSTAKLSEHHVTTSCVRIKQSMAMRCTDNKNM
mmetsp:Transcript_37610/g.61176  ORF Transcript_37610/g.61176 Transcript_37610/m.61176 type:complete len:81 (-) Transcript_37610:38-280(-)